MVKEVGDAVGKSGLFFFMIALGSRSSLASSFDGVVLTGHVPARQIATAQHLGRVARGQQMSLAIPLKLRNEASLVNLIQQLHTPGHPNYGKFLSPAQFTERFAPTPDDYDTVIANLQANGLSQLTMHPNRLLISVTAKTEEIEKALQIEIHQYRTAEGRIAFAPTSEPTVPAGMAPLIHGVVGLNNFTVPRHQYKLTVGSGPGGGLTPANITEAYSFSGVASTGGGQNIAVAEFDGYAASDIAAYAQQFGIGSPPSLKNVLIDGFNGTPSGGQDSGSTEVTLDIEMAVGVAPGASSIMVYEAPPPTNASFESEEIDVYTRIANDNLAKTVSTSWGAPENEIQTATANAENTAFMQMAAQGQSMFAASGDSGAYGDGQNLVAQDPSTQPYVVAVGGTHLNLSGGGTYVSESSGATSLKANRLAAAAELV